MALTTLSSRNHRFPTFDCRSSFIQILYVLQLKLSFCVMTLASYKRETMMFKAGQRLREDLLRCPFPGFILGRRGSNLDL
ncbi:hypothetical protein K402DRAFT_398111 [Aulographum hederae CBS 113979]|uniref:Uncharacterized protein n=1 Tax=Aulographum hederae CBS 113979 TaxID=1176131 RepID=A0A6G1GMA3_9PEZI|nr:hypothetical protein K402DRAFT_398111 [Aulographum hederae CBS 113979]